MADIPTDPFIPSRRLALAASLSFGVIALSVSAQGFPGGGMGHGQGRRGGERPESRADGKAGEPRLRPHVFTVLATALDKESASMALKPPAADALREFVRELRDFAALDDRHVRERMGWTRGTVYAVMDLQRDLGDAGEAAHELAASGADVLDRWKKLREQLDDAQRDRIEAIYRGALADASAPPQGPK